MFRPLKQRVSLSPGFLLLFFWFATVNGWSVSLMILGAAAVHELGHGLVLKLFGGQIDALRIGMFGAVMESNLSRFSYGRELAVVLAGPLVNFLCALVLSATGDAHWFAAIGANLVLGLFNLLPIRPLDGGRALYLLVAWFFEPEAGDWAVRCLGTVSAVALAFGLLYFMWQTGGSLWLLPPSVSLLLLAVRESFGRNS